MRTGALRFCKLRALCRVAGRRGVAYMLAMLMKRPSPIAAAAVLLASSALAQPDAAADYPNHPVRIIVSTSAGGGVDTVTRIIAAQLQEKLSQPFVIENRGGGGGNIGAEAVYTAEPDGYTLLASQPSPITSNIALYKKLNFDPVALESVAVMSKIPNLLLVRQDFPAKTAAEFVAYAKANPGRVTFASQGPGTTSHLSGAQFSELIGAKMVHIPYRGTGPALNDLIGGQVDCFFTELATAYKLHTGGRARILAVATERRLDVLPDIPTVSEAGVPGFVSDTWNAISAPPRTPAAIVSKLNRAVNAALDEPEIKARYQQQHLWPGGGSPADMAKLKKEETERWTKVIHDAGIEQQ
jgi:tripartite-type tricarboxylate transporter receptor subunit TctC